MVKSMRFEGTFEAPGSDQSDVIEWLIRESHQSTPPWSGSTYEIITTIRSIRFSGGSFDTLDPDPDSTAEAEKAGLTIGGVGLTGCTLSGRLPCVIDVNGSSIDSSIDFVLDLREVDNRAIPANLRLSLSGDLSAVEIVDDWFEDGLLRLEDALPDHVRLRSCITCLYSDYSPAGHGLIGILCHREAKDQYLAVASKADYWSVPVTEEVVETYVCGEFVRRIPGTGYRG